MLAKSFSRCRCPAPQNCGQTLHPLLQRTVGSPQGPTSSVGGTGDKAPLLSLRPPSSSCLAWLWILITVIKLSSPLGYPATAFVSMTPRGSELGRLTMYCMRKDFLLFVHKALPFNLIICPFALVQFAVLYPFPPLFSYTIWTSPTIPVLAVIISLNSVIKKCLLLAEALRIFSKIDTNILLG